ncbi:MAG: hypothetical protein NVSMB5_26180 [Candidatus Velthaea sp.]
MTFRTIVACMLACAAAITSAEAATVYRVVVFAVDPGRVVIAGGGVLRRAAACACTATTSGRAAYLELDGDGSVVRLEPADPHAGGVAGAESIPPSAFVFARAASTTGDRSQPVEVRITVTVPARTPPTDDIYLSTEKNGWRPADLLMSRVDSSHWTIVQTLPRGARFAYRFTRGSFATGERTAAAQVPPAHIVLAQPNTQVTVDVARWADIE